MTPDTATWRATAAGRPGYATYPDTRPGNPCWWAKYGQQPPARPTRDIHSAPRWTGPDPLISGRLTPIPGEVPEQVAVPAATWRPASPGDTPGELVPEHGPTQPVRLRPAAPAETAPLPEQVAGPGEPLPPLPDTAYLADAAALPMPPDPETPGPNTTGRRQLDPGSPWRWLRQISPF